MGIRIDDDSLRPRLISAGATPGTDKDVVLLPEKMVREHVSLCPSSFRLAALTGTTTELNAGSPSQFWTSNAMHLVTGGERHEIRAQDLADFATVADALENASAVVGTSIADVPPAGRDFVGFRIMAEHTRKHLRPCLYTPAGVEAIIEMAELLLDGTPIRERPIFSLGYTAVSPLRWTASALAIFERSSGHGIPTMVNGEPTAGTTGPVTLAGSIALANAEVLSGLVILQMLEPGRPCIHNVGFSHVADMRSGMATSGAPEDALMAAAGAQMARRYGLPSASWVSSDASMCDGQCAHETTLGMLLHCLAGVTVVWGIGSLESELSISMEKAVLDDQIAAAVLRARRGIGVSDETLAAGVMEEVGRSSDFMGHPHTLAHFRRALWHPLLFKRGRRESWQGRGGKAIEEAARETVRDILGRDRPDCLTDLQRRQLLEIERVWLERARA
jgi:trimethylamine--corrinoid protein Co-methyltransferase